MESEPVKERNAAKFRAEEDADEPWHSREDFIEAYQGSQLYRDVMDKIEELNAPEEDDEQSAEVRWQITFPRIAHSLRDMFLFFFINPSRNHFWIRRPS